LQNGRGRLGPPDRLFGRPEDDELWVGGELGAGCGLNLMAAILPWGLGFSRLVSTMRFKARWHPGDAIAGRA
jgi:hypothetical protein